MFYYWWEGGNFYERKNQKIMKIAPSLSGNEKNSNAGFCGLCKSRSGKQKTQKPALEPFSLPLSDGAKIAIFWFAPTYPRPICCPLNRVFLKLYKAYYRKKKIGWQKSYPQHMHTRHNYPHQPTNFFKSSRANASLKRRLCWSRIPLYMKQLFEAINHCHAKGVVHPDTKPDNIMVNN